MTKSVIFTDLDGTLLHPKTYSFEEARAALREIVKRKIPLVLCSSKTRAEIEVWRKRLDNGHPFISENGGGVFIPGEYFPFPAGGLPRSEYLVTILGLPYDRIRKTFTSLREELDAHVRGFGDMDTDEVAKLTGLSREDAALAKEREFDEPFVLEQPFANTDAFLRAIEARGCHWTRGRFHHITGENDKGKAALLLKELYQKQYGPVTTIGLGDSLNDLPLLRVVDYPVLVRKEDGSYDENISLPNLIRADGVGPLGWNRAVTRFLAE
jgi:mannosyl-3-phosphoglycerate phosphatase